jgi:POT family proton-dependent oligopeptide transporter
MMKTADNFGRWLNQPKGFFIPLLTMMLMFVGFTLIQSLTVLYATQKLGFTDKQAYTLFAAYFSLLFGLPFFGGYIGGRWLGSLLSVSLGLILSTLGLFSLSIPTLTNFYLGLSAFVVGVALYVPNLYVVLGRLYQPGDYRRDSGFTLNYMGFNIGGLFGMAASGYLVKYYSYHFTFLIGALLGVVALIIFFAGLSRLTQIKDEKHTKKSRILGVVLALIAIPLTSLLLDHAQFNNALLLTTGIAAAILTIVLAMRETGESRKKMFAFLILLIIGLAFWTLYSLVPSVLELFMERNVNREVFHSIIPTSSLTSLNPFFIVTVGALLTAVWIYLGKRNSAPSLATKFCIAVLLMGAGYLVLIPGIHYSNALGQVGIGWIVISYFLQTTGELFIGPIGFSMVGTLVPKRFENLMMGIWQLATGVSCALSSYLALLAAAPEKIKDPLQTNPIYTHSFAVYGGMTVTVGLIAVLFIPKLKKIIGKSKPLSTFH